MRKVITSLMIIFCLSLIGTGVFIMTGSSQQISSQSGGGNEEVTTPTDPPAQANATTNVYVEAKILDSSISSINPSTTSMSTTEGPGWPYFNVYALNTSGNRSTFGDDKTVTLTPIISNSTSKPSDGQAAYAYKFTWNYTKSTVKRYLKIQIKDTNYSTYYGRRYAFFGINTLNNNLNNLEGDLHVAYYLYKDTYTTTESVAKSGCDTWLGASDKTSKISYYLYFRRIYTLSFNTHGGNSIDSVNVYAGTTYSVSKTPTRTGYTFKGWALKETGGSPSVNFKLYTNDIDGDLTIHAYWTANRYLVTLSNTFPSVRGTTTDLSPTSFYAEYDSTTKYSASTGTGVITYKAPTCVGSTLKGWVDSSGTIIMNGSGTITSAWKKASATTLTAKWEYNQYTITLDKNGGSGGTASVTATYGSTGSWTITAPTRTYYTLRGWTTTQNGSTILIDASGKLRSNVSSYTNSSGQWIYTGTKTVYAKWDTTQYSIYLKWNTPDKGDESWGIMYVDYGLGYSMGSSSYTTKLDVSTLVRTGYKFNGFWTATSGGTQIVDSGGNILKSATYFTDYSTLYAQWAPDFISVTLKKMVSDYTSTFAESTAGGTVSVSYYTNSNNSPTLTTKSYSGSTTISALKGYSVSFSASVDTTADGEYGYKFHFNGFSTKSSWTSTWGVTDTYSADGSANVTVYAYFQRFFELTDTNDQVIKTTKYGLFPQTKQSASVTSSVLTGTNVGSMLLPISDGITANIYKYNSKFYAVYAGESYLFEPIVWMLEPNDLFGSSYRAMQGAPYSNTLAVSQKVLLGGRVNVSYADCTYSWKFENSLMYKVVSNHNSLNKGLTTYEGLGGGTDSAVYDSFGASNSPDKVVSSTKTDSSNLRVASIDEINRVTMSTYSDGSPARRKCEFTDFAKDIITKNGGSVDEYWTRDLGPYTQQGKTIDSHGGQGSKRLDAVLGVRFAIKIPLILTFVS